MNRFAFYMAALITIPLVGSSWAQPGKSADRSPWI
jgi:hypothetical protein